jgi:nucleotide-binding universal stress UspA family protein
VDCYRKVLVPIDFSPGSKRAAEMALQIAPKAHMTFLHAYQVWFEPQMLEPGVPKEVIRQYRDEAADEARRSLDLFIAGLESPPHSFSRVVNLGSPVEVISTYAEGIHPELIAIGKHGGSGVQERILGSVTRRATNRAFCDVLIATAENGTKDGSVALSSVE